MRLILIVVNKYDVSKHLKNLTGILISAKLCGKGVNEPEGDVRAKWINDT